MKLEGVGTVNAVNLYIALGCANLGSFSQGKDAVSNVVRRKAVTQKDVWIQALVECKGKKCAAVALANKTVRTAFAMLT